MRRIGTGEEFVEEIQRGNKEFLGGNVAHFQKFVGANSKVTYFGDDLNGDIYTVKRRCPTWFTVAVVEELYLNVNKGQEAITPHFLERATGADACVGDVLDIPNHFQQSRKLTTSMVAILLIGCLLFRK